MFCGNGPLWQLEQETCSTPAEYSAQISVKLLGCTLTSAEVLIMQAQQGGRWLLLAATGSRRTVHKDSLAAVESMPASCMHDEGPLITKDVHRGLDAQ